MTSLFPLNLQQRRRVREGQRRIRWNQRRRRNLDNLVSPRALVAEEEVEEELQTWETGCLKTTNPLDTHFLNLLPSLLLILTFTKCILLDRCLIQELLLQDTNPFEVQG